MAMSMNQNAAGEQPSVPRPFDKGKAAGFAYLFADAAHTVAGMFTTSHKQGEEGARFSLLKIASGAVSFVASALLAFMHEPLEADAGKVVADLDQALARGSLDEEVARLRQEQAALPLRERAVVWLRKHAMPLSIGMHGAGAGLLAASGAQRGNYAEAVTGVVETGFYASLLASGKEHEGGSEKEDLRSLGLGVVTTAAGLWAGKKDLDNPEMPNVAGVLQVAGTVSRFAGDAGVFLANREEREAASRCDVVEQAARLAEARGMDLTIEGQRAALAEYLGMHAATPYRQDKALAELTQRLQGMGIQDSGVQA